MERKRDYQWNREGSDKKMIRALYMSNRILVTDIDSVEDDVENISVSSSEGYPVIIADDRDTLISFLEAMGSCVDIEFVD